MLASFERVCNLVTDTGEVIALVWDGVGNGPLNVVLAQRLGVSLPAGARFAVTGKGDLVRSEPAIVDPILPATGSQIRIRAAYPGMEALAGQVVCGKQLAEASSRESYLAISPVVIDLAAAVPWNPQPDWDHLRTLRGQIAAGAKVIAGILAEAGWTPVRCGLPEVICKLAACGDKAALGALVGLGPGLTPAGDDWLAGWLLAHHISKDLREPATEITAEYAEGAEREEKTSASSAVELLLIAADCTTTLGGALLACAAAGEADESWHALLASLAEVPMTNPPIYQSTQPILSHGATSGAAMLAGFCAGIAHLNPDS